MHIAIVANGIFDFASTIKKQLSSFSSVIAVDGGLRHCEALGITPNLIIGDFDSVTSELLNKFSHIEQKCYPTDKDKTDLEIAIEDAAYQKGAKISVFGAFGARMDHTLANAIIISRYPGNIFFETDQEIIFAIDKTVSLTCKIGQTISLIPLNGPAQGITTHGLKWELKNGVLDKNFVGISNVALKEKVTISVKKGDLLCCINHAL